MKACVVFEKTPRLRFIGHLDLMRTMQRALRRSDLPVRYSQGFNPHILLSFAFPLSVGMAGKREIMEVPLDKELSAEEFEQKFSRVLPPDLPIVQVHIVRDDHPAYMALLKAASYDALFDDGMPFHDEELAGFLSQREIPAVRKTKSGQSMVDMKPLVYSASMESKKVRLLLAAEESGTCKPDMFFQALGGFLAGREIRPSSVTRTQLWGFSEDGTLRPLETL